MVSQTEYSMTVRFHYATKTRSHKYLQRGTDKHTHPHWAKKMLQGGSGWCRVTSQKWPRCQKFRNQSFCRPLFFFLSFFYELSHWQPPSLSPSSLQRLASGCLYASSYGSYIRHAKNKPRSSRAPITSPTIGHAC